MSRSHGNHILLSQTGISASGLYAETQTRCQKELLSSRLCNRIKDNSGLQSENSFYASVAWLDAQGSSCFISDLIFRPGSPCFSWSCVKICISLIKIIQMCLAELIFICFLFFFKLCKSSVSDKISGKQRRWHYSNVKNRSGGTIVDGLLHH